MGNTTSTDPNAPVLPTKAEMRTAEDACAECSNRSCEPLEYPGFIQMRINRDYVLHDSGKLHRWHIVVNSGVPASKWPRDIGKEEGFVKQLLEVTKGLGEKCAVSLIPESPVGNSNPNEATDITIFPSFTRYHSVLPEQLPALLKYHTEVLDKRHQEHCYHRSNPESYPEPSQSDIESIDDLSPAASNYHNISPYLRKDDIKAYNVGIDFPLPCDVTQHTIMLICGHTIRDKRCGVTGPILVEQISKVLGKKFKNEEENVQVSLVSHVGGHKVAGNVLIFSKEFGFVFYGRVFPEHIENIIEKTVINGEILKPLVRAQHDDLW